MQFSLRTILIVVALAAISATVVSQTFLRELFFAENKYFAAKTTVDLPQRYRDYIPQGARDIRLRSYQTAWWITVESTCTEEEAATWAFSIDRPLDSKGAIPELPDHSLPAHELAFLTVKNTPGRYVWHSGNHGNVSNVVYDRFTKRLYYVQSRN